MKFYVIIILAFLSTQVIAQSRTIIFDYTVDYAIPNRKKMTQDTVQINLSRDGRYIHTRNAALSQELTKSFLNKGFGGKMQNVDFDLIFDTQNLDMHVNLASEGLEFYMKMNMLNLLNKEAKGKNEDVTLVTARIEDDIRILDKQVDAFFVWPDIKPENKMFMAVYPEFPVDNNAILKRLLEVLVTSSKPDLKLSMDIPNGLIMVVKENDRALIEAVAIEEVKKQIELSHDFKLSE